MERASWFQAFGLESLLCFKDRLNYCERGLKVESHRCVEKFSCGFHYDSIEYLTNILTTFLQDSKTVDFILQTYVIDQPMDGLNYMPVVYLGIEEGYKEVYFKYKDHGRSFEVFTQEEYKYTVFHRSRDDWLKSLQPYLNSTVWSSWASFFKSIPNPDSIMYVEFSKQDVHESYLFNDYLYCRMPITDPRVMNLKHLLKDIRNNSMIDSFIETYSNTHVSYIRVACKQNLEISMTLYVRLN